MSEPNHITLPLFPEETQEQEIWKDIPEWEGVYQASTLGRILRIKTHHRKRDFIPTIVKSAPGTGGYLRVTLNDAPRRKSQWTHILIARTFLGPPPEGMEVDHVSGIKSDCSLKNLEYVTRLENRRRACKLGLHSKGKKRPHGNYLRGDDCPARKHPEQMPRGDHHGMAKLTAEQVLEIRSRPHDTLKTLALEFHQGQSNISRIRRRQIWKHI